MEPITALYWLCILAAPAVLLLAAVRCLYLDRGWRRNVLALILGLLVGALLLWLGGGWVLSRFGLAWRAWLASLLLGAALVLAVLAAAFTVCSLVHRRHHLAEALLVDASALVFLMVMVVLGPFLWGPLCGRSGWWSGRDRPFWRRSAAFHVKVWTITTTADRWSVERPPSCFWVFRRMGLRRRTDSNGTNRGLQNWTGSFQVFMV